jgi:hypothetical protein
VIDTTVLDIQPLDLASGVNNIYYSSNGPATADGTVDPSLQCIVSPAIYNNGRKKVSVARTKGTRTKSTLRGKSC